MDSWPSGLDSRLNALTLRFQTLAKQADEMPRS